jgi:hypothetical protein
MQDVNAPTRSTNDTLDPTVLARSWPDYAVACAGMAEAGVRMEAS